MGNRKEKKNKHKNFLIFPTDANIRKNPEEEIITSKEIVHEIMAGSTKGVGVPYLAVESGSNHIIALYKYNLRD